jgi:hypothetical protein
MTLIPADTKDTREQAMVPIAEASSHRDGAIPPPAYSETDETMVGSVESLGTPPVNMELPGYRPPLLQPQKIPQSNAINANQAVNLEGPLHILGAAKSSSSVTFFNTVTVEGKVSSSSSITLGNNVIVNGKVDSSSTIKLRNNVRVLEKVDASGSVEYVWLSIYGRPLLTFG